MVKEESGSLQMPPKLGKESEWGEIMAFEEYFKDVLF